MFSESESGLAIDRAVGTANRQTLFGALWAGQSISIIGSQFSSLAIQMVAVTTLRATPTQTGFLAASQTLPYLGLSLLVGALIDRVSKRALLLAADVIRAALLMAGAIIFSAGHMTIWGLCALICLVSIFTLIFDAALGAAIPQLFEPSRRISVNSRLNLSMSAADVVGPTMSGYALHLVSVPGTMLLDCLSYIVSAVFVWWGIPNLKASSVSPPAIESNTGLFRSIVEGVRFVWSQPTLRTLGIGSGIWNFSWSAVLAVLVIHCANDLRLATTQIGFCYAAGGFGGLIGSIMGWYLGKHFQRGPVLVVTPLIGISGGLTLLLPTQNHHPFVLVALGLFLYNLGESSFGVNMQTARQIVTPQRLMGRMDTAMRFCFKGLATLGAIAGGMIASRDGLQATLSVGTAGLILTFVVFLCSDLRQLSD